MSSPIRAVLFDAVGTLIHPDPAVADVYFQFGRSFGSSVSRDDVAERLKCALREQEQADRTSMDSSISARSFRRPTSEAREHDRWKQIVKSVFSDVPDAGGELFAGLWQHFADSGNWRVFEDVPDLWTQLKRRGLVLGIASNFDRRLAAICRRLEPLNSCAHIFCSSLLGHPKPSPHFFRGAEQQLKLNPDQILMVGDDWENDYQGATAAGWHAFHLDRLPDAAKDRSANSLEQVVQLIDGINS